MVNPAEADRTGEADGSAALDGVDLTLAVGSGVRTADDGENAASVAMGSEGIADEDGVEVEQPATRSTVRKVAARPLRMDAPFERFADI